METANPENGCNSAQANHPTPENGSNTARATGPNPENGNNTSQEMGEDWDELKTPECEAELKPYVGQRFVTLEAGIEFYKAYARAVGFDVRLAAARKVGDTKTWQYSVCNREGQKHAAIEGAREAEDAMMKVRRRVSKRCNCPARVVFKLNGLLGYRINLFVEQHNHPLVEDQYKHFMKLNRNLDHMHQKFILDCAKANIGPTHSYKLLKELLGGHEGVGCTLLDVRNFTRDMKAFVQGSDAQMMLNEMARKKEVCNAFTFEYEVDGEDKLKRVFWCDPIGKRNYHTFGDVVAFDTTYSTNKYCMIFAPFTGKDNHGKPVTFAAGLLSREDAESFSWLFQKFMSCMGTKPSLLITDQDLGMKKAAEQVLVGTRHRWCMWHIMLKLAEKVSKELHANETFKKDLNAYVWSETTEPEVFEEGWQCIMETYGLVGDVWFKNMYKARHNWVPSYFRDYPMSSLVRTTSISESENSFYKRYTRSRSNLLEFWMKFNNALEAQRHAAAHMDFIDKTVLPTMTTTLPFEKKAATIYSTEMFKVVQEELYSAANNCTFDDVVYGETEDKYKVIDEYGELCFVVHNRAEETYVCSCKLFVRKGILCRHVFLIFKNKRLRAIPSQYVIGRWKKLAEVTPVHESQLADERNYVVVNEVQQLTNKIMATVYGSLQQIDGNSDKLTALLSGIMDVCGCVTGQTSPSIVNEKKKAFQKFYEADVPDTVEVLPPDVIKTKGSGSRLISRQEKAAKLLLKPKRRCAKCNEMAYHDARNCDKVATKKMKQ